MRLKPPDLVWIGVLLSVTAGCAGLAEREPKVSRVTADARGRLSVNGQPFFLREIYTLRNREDFAVAKACGFNAVIEQGGEVLDMALANGMMVTIPNWFALGYDADAVRRQVERFGSHRALLAWNLCDEPDLRVNESPPSLMKEVGAMLRQLDPHHPLSVTCAGGAGQRHWKDFADAVDVFRIDPYPVIARRPIADVARMTRAAREAAGGQKPVFVILQAWIGDEGDRLPTAQEDRCMTYMALIEGAKGISHFDFNVGTWQRSSSFWNGLMAMNLELQRLSPILLDGLDEKVSVSRGKARVMAKEHAGRTYVFVANPQPSVSDFTVALERGPVWDVKALFENVFFDEKARRVQAAGRGFWDVLPAFGAAVYEVRRWPWQASLADAASVVVEPSSQAQAVRVMSRRHFIVKNVTDDRVRASAEWLTGRKPSVFELDAAHRRMRRVGHERRGGTLEFMAAPQTAYEIGSLADVVDAQLRSATGRAEDLLGDRAAAAVRNAGHGKEDRETAQTLLEVAQSLLAHRYGQVIAEEVFEAVATMGDVGLTLSGEYAAGGGFNVPAHRFRAFPGGRFRVDVSVQALPWVSVDEVAVRLCDQNGRELASSAVRTGQAGQFSQWLTMPQAAGVNSDLLTEVTVKYLVGGQVGWVRRALRFAVEPSFEARVEYESPARVGAGCRLAGTLVLATRFHGYPFGALEVRASGLPPAWSAEFAPLRQTETGQLSSSLVITCAERRASSLHEVVSPALQVSSGGQQILSHPLPRLMMSPDGLIQIADARPKQATALKGQPQVDGKLDDECWRRATPLTGFMPVGETDFTERQTVARLCWDDRCLYVAAQCFGRPKAEIRAEATKRDEPMPFDDVVELLLRPSGSSRVYRIKVNPHGAAYDTACEVRGESIDWKGDAGWNASLTIAAMQREDGWQFEMAIPLADLGVMRIEEGGTCGLNLITARSVGPREVESWSHIADWPPGSAAFGALEFASSK